MDGTIRRTARITRGRRRLRPVARALACGILALVCAGCGQEEPATWFKGNLHTHSLWSDGNDFPESVAAWYADRDYDFLALSDHNVLSRGEMWMSLEAIEKRGAADALAKCRARFGDDWVETRDVDGKAQVRLKRLEEVRGRLEEPGRFLMIEAEEITDRFEGRPVHINAIHLDEVVEPRGGYDVRDVMRRNLAAVREQERRTGRAILAHLNHPNFGWGITAEDLAAVVEERFFEVFNGHPSVRQQGDGTHPGVERLWDIACTLRIADLREAPLLGVATDDSHKYHGPEGSIPGRGWVMVKADELEPEALIRAMRAGDFYASTGVTLRRADWDAARRRLTIEVEPEPNAEYRIVFLGTREGFDATRRPVLDDEGNPREDVTRQYSSDVGAVLDESRGTSATYTLRGDELYVRARIESSLPVDRPVWDDQKRCAWTQPVGWRERLSPE